MISSRATAACLLAVLLLVAYAGWSSGPTAVPPGAVRASGDALPPGLLAGTGEGVWNGAPAVSAFDLPRFGGRYAFYALCAAGILLLGLVIQYARLSGLRAKEQELLRLAADRERALAENQRLLAEVLQQRQRLDDLVAAVPGIVWEAWGAPDAAAQRIDFVSRRVESMLGYSTREWLETPNFWLSIVHPDDREEAARVPAEQFARGSGGPNQFRWITKDGRVIWAEALATVIHDEQGRPIGMRGVTFDITERRMLEERVRQQERMETIGRLAAGVAHDFNNLLTPIIGHADMAVEDLRKGQMPAIEDLTLVADAARSAAALTRRLLAFSRQQILRPEILDLNTVTTDFSMMLRRLVGEHIAVTMRLAPDLGHVHADRGEVEQIILNLAVNARDAMPDGGMLLIETANATVEAGPSERRSPAPGAYVALTVSDTGVGMTPDVKAHLFEPFFTTKDIGRGTGLGMATVHGVVSRSGGHIEVESEPGQGTTVRVYLPRVTEAGGAEDGTDGAAHGARPAGRETILLVEDSGALRHMAERMLTRAGYRVLPAGDIDTALAICDEHPGRIDLLLTDVVMPGTNGQDLARVLTERRPGMRVLFMSGYLTAGSGGEDAAALEYLPKPFSAEALAQKVREALHGAGS